LLNNVRCCAFFGFILRSFELFPVVWFVFFKISVGLAAVVWMSDFALVK
jgi:hypothetical protein